MVLCRSVIPRAIMAVALVTVAGIVRAADDLPKAGKQVVTVTGKIKVTNHGDAARFDRRMLSALPQHRLETYADPADSLQVFEGPSRADLVPLVDAHGETRRAAPLNDRGVTVPIADTDDYPSLLALRQNREPIVGRTKGPVWINYPNLDPDAATASPHNDKSVGQLRSLDGR